MNRKRPFQLLLIGVLFATLAVGTASAAHYDPPGRVARLSDLRGSISYSPAGESDWLRAVRNRPLVNGDRLWADRRSRVELQLGAATWRLGEYSGLEILNLDDRIGQVQLTQGSLNLNVRRLYRNQSYEIATPTLAFVVTEPGSYRIDVDPDGEYTTVVIWKGGGEAYGERANFPMREGDAITFYDTDLRDYEEYALPTLDNFDRYCLTRDDRMYQSVSLRYVSDDLIGYADLDEYGSWRPVRDYGTVWFPTRVSVGWTPYREGHWVWQEPWGWTWVDDAPWGFAPSHYGRWAYLGGQWGWIPGPRRERAIYAPALVAFVGGRNWSVGINLGGGSPIGWFPLGPREVYVPSYYVSRDYFTRINVTNTVINTTNITNIYNNYSSGQSIAQVDYANRYVQDAVTAVPSDVFVNAKPVSASNIRLARNAVANVDVTPVAEVAPSARSLAGAAAAADSKPNRAIFDRKVVAVATPAQETAPFTARQRQLQKEPGRPLSDSEIEAVRPRGRDAMAQSVRVLGEQPRAVNIRETTDDRDASDARKPLDRQALETAPRQPAERGRQAQSDIERQRDSTQRDRAEQDERQGQAERDRRMQGEAQRRAETERSAQIERERQAEVAQQEETRRQRQQEREQQELERERRQAQEDAQRQRQAERQQADQRQRQAQRDQQAEQQRQAQRVAEQAEQQRRQSERAQQAEQQRQAQRAAEEAEQRRQADERGQKEEQQRQAQRAAQEAEQQRQAQRAAEAAEQQRQVQRAAEAADQQRQQAEQAQREEKQRQDMERYSQQAEQQRLAEERARSAPPSPIDDEPEGRGNGKGQGQEDDEKDKGKEDKKNRR